MISVLLLPLIPPLPGNACHSYLEPYRMVLVYSIRDMFVCSLVKKFGHLSDRTKKIEIDRIIMLEHYTLNKVFVSCEGYLLSTVIDRRRDAYWEKGLTRFSQIIDITRYSYQLDAELI